MRVRQDIDLFILQNCATVEDLWAGALSCNKGPFLDVLFSFYFACFQNHILIEATIHIPTFWKSNLHEWPRISEENGVLHLLCQQCSFGNTWPFGMFQSQYPVINFPLGLIEIDPCLITSYETIKYLLSDILGTSSGVVLSCSPSYLLAYREQMGDPV